MMTAMAQDKKVAQGALTLILARGLGAAYIERGVDETALAAFLDRGLDTDLDMGLPGATNPASGSGQPAPA